MYCIDERRRESEASAPSADEGGENSAAEDKAQDSIEFSGGKVKKLAKRFEIQATEKENSVPPDKIEDSLKKTPTEEPVLKSADLEQNPVDLKMSIDDIDKKTPDAKDKEPKSNCSSPASSRSR